MNINWEWHSKYNLIKRRNLSYRAMKSDSGNSSKEKKNVIN